MRKPSAWRFIIGTQQDPSARVTVTEARLVARQLGSHGDYDLVSKLTGERASC